MTSRHSGVKIKSVRDISDDMKQDFFGAALLVEGGLFPQSGRNFSMGIALSAGFGFFRKDEFSYAVDRADDISGLALV